MSAPRDYAKEAMQLVSLVNSDGTASRTYLQDAPLAQTLALLAIQEEAREAVAVLRRIADAVERGATTGETGDKAGPNPGVKPAAPDTRSSPPPDWDLIERALMRANKWDTDAIGDALAEVARARGAQP